MAQTFTSPSGNFSCRLESKQCLADTRKGKRCKRMTRQQLPYCHEHAKTVLGVELKKSSIPNAGKGLFAVKEFRKQDLIVPYGGETIDREELEERYGADTAAYAFQLQKNLFLDAACVRGVGSMANTNPGHNNARIKVKGRERREAGLYATKKINIGDEILASYGPYVRDYVSGNLRHEPKKSSTKKSSTKKSSTKKSSTKKSSTKKSSTKKS